MKALNKFFYALLALATVGMVACSKDSTYQPGPAELEGCYDVYFPSAADLEEQGPLGEVSLDPSEKTVFTYTAYRNNVEGTITVPVDIISNTGDLFTVTPIEFAEGKDVTTFTVTLADTAEIGVPYTFSLAVNDPQYTKQYESSNANAISVIVTRVKWIDVGTCVYTEDLALGWYNLPYSSVLNVKMQVRADSIDEKAFQAALAGTGSDAGLAGLYRMVNPYAEWAATPVGGVTFYDANIIINAQNPTQVWIPLQEIGISVNDGKGEGPLSIYSYAGYYLDNGREPYLEDYGFIKNGILQFPVDRLLGCPGGSKTGSNTYYANRNGGWTINLAPALNKYTLELPEGNDDADFTFTEVALPEEAMFFSESQCDYWYPVLEKGKVAVTTDDVDRDFVAQYGTLYRLPSLYAEEFPIYFAAMDNGTVTLPEVYAEQYTGLVQNGYDVMMAIDAAASTFNPETGELSLKAEFYTYQSTADKEYLISYGTFSEVISTQLPDFQVVPNADPKVDFTFNSLFTDTLKSSYLDENREGVALEKGVCDDYFKSMQFEELFGTLYRIPSMYQSGYDIYFVADAEGKVSVLPGYELQATGVSTYGVPTYIKIMKGTMAKNGVTLTVAIYNAEGEALMPNACTEQLHTYNWIETATGTYVPSLFKWSTEGVVMEHAEDTDIYRLVDFWGAEGYNLNFTWDQATNKCEIQGLVNTGMYYDTDFMYILDGKTFYALFKGVDLSWAEVEAEGLPQPSFDPATNTFTFSGIYYIPEIGKAYACTDTFTLDGAVSAPEWVEVATGGYTGFWTDQNGNPYVCQGVKMLNNKGTNEYRLIDWCEMGDSSLKLNFTMNPENGKIDVVGMNDSGVSASTFGAPFTENAYFVDVRNLLEWSEGEKFTWEDVAANFNGADLQSYFDPQTQTIHFYGMYIFPENEMLLSKNIMHETYTIDSEAAPAGTTAVLRKVASETIAIVKANRVAKTTRMSGKLNGVSMGKVSIPNHNVEATRSIKTATPVKKSKSNIELCEKLN
ncbi:MAG: hypothetical protein IIV72_07930 [Alistipes sp.]|nr:hypothetical protein [Alistipes sp.]